MVEREAARWEDSPLGKALCDVRHKAAGDFKTPIHQGQRGCDWDAGLIAACRVAEDHWRASLHPAQPVGEPEGWREAIKQAFRQWRTHDVKKPSWFLADHSDKLVERIVAALASPPTNDEDRSRG